MIDGATGLGGLSGKMAAETIANVLLNFDSTYTLFGCIQKGNDHLGIKTVRELGMDMKKIPKENRSTCGLAAIKINKTNFDYIHAGDCMIFVKYQTGEIRALTYDHIMKLDNISIELFNKKMTVYDQLGDAPNENDSEAVTRFLKNIRGEILPTLIENRRKLNTMNGYGVIDGSNEAMEYVEYGRVSLQNTSEILLLTDGLQLPSEDTIIGQSMWTETAEFAFENGLEHLKSHIIQLEQSDNICRKYPRLKPADDKTGIWIKL